MVFLLPGSRAFPFLVIAWALWLVAIGLGEQVPANDGLGWDGVRFARYATDGPQALFDREINRYYVQRVGPSLVVHSVIRALGLPFDSVSIRWTFLVMNLILLSGSILMLVDIGRRLRLSTIAQWFLFCGLFVNPANGRLPVYYANIGDSVAFTIGMTMLWGWVVRKPWILFMGSAAALVSWPAAFYLLVPLIVWPRARDHAASSDDGIIASPFAWTWVTAALPLGAVLMAASWGASAMPEVPGWTPWTTASLAANAWLLGMAAMAAMVLINRSTVRLLATAWSMRGVVTALALGLAGHAFVAATESGSLAFSEQTYWREVLLYVRTRPFAPTVGHAAYYGVLAVIACAVWPRAVAAARRLGPGPFVCMALAGLQALDAESRRLNANWPLVALCAVMAAEPWLHNPRLLATAAVLSLAFSKLWWRWCGPNLFAEAHEPGNYYNLQGPSLSHEAYAVHLVATAVVATAVWLWVRRPPAPAPASAPPPAPTPALAIS